MSFLIKIHPERHARFILVHVAETVPLYKSRLVKQRSKGGRSLWVHVHIRGVPMYAHIHMRPKCKAATKNVWLAFYRLNGLNLQRWSHWRLLPKEPQAGEAPRPSPLALCFGPLRQL